ncbi:hypothetical protein BKA82DRAFT_4194280 [Pisolithus tinctorius]|nr:hypothetical protein BKA82DRAFT_4194280 [Pisolithus tinctorius]
MLLCLLLVPYSPIGVWPRVHRFDTFIVGQRHALISPILKRWINSGHLVWSPPFLSFCLVCSCHCGNKLPCTTKHSHRVMHR